MDYFYRRFSGSLVYGADLFLQKSRRYTITGCGNDAFFTARFLSFHNLVCRSFPAFCVLRSRIGSHYSEMENIQIIFNEMTRGISTIVFLIISNIFMTLAWYGHLKMEELGWLKKAGIFTIILISWGLALFEYIFQVPANRMGFSGNGGPYNLFQLKVIQEVITLIVFVIFAVVVFKNIKLGINHLYAAICLVLAVYFVFRK